MKILIVLCEGPLSDSYKIFSVIRSERISVGEEKSIWLPAVLDRKKWGLLSIAKRWLQSSKGTSLLLIVIQFSRGGKEKMQNLPEK